MNNNEVLEGIAKVLTTLRDEIRPIAQGKTKKRRVEEAMRVEGRVDTLLLTISLLQPAPPKVPHARFDAPTSSNDAA